MKFNLPVGCRYKEIMTRIIAFVLLGGLLFGSSAHAVDGLECVLSVRQYDQMTSRSVLLYADTVELVKGVSAVGAITAFSVELQVTETDSSQASFLAHIVTIGQPAANYSRSFRVEYGLPARIDHIEGKGDAEYSFEILPLGRVDIDTTYCDYLHTSEDDFKFDPTAHLDIYYVPFTLGDFYWNTVKGLMEPEYRRFRDLNKFNLPGKYTLFLCPCRIHSVIWDKRFGMMVDPTRGILFSIYTKKGNSTHPFLILHASILKNYGYAPPFLSEGYAGYLSDAPYAMKKIVAEGRTLPLDSLLDTYRYFQAEPLVADKMAATFVRYLIESYQIDAFLDLYRLADDLTLRESIEQVYDRTISELEQEWLHYVDTITVKNTQLRYYSDMAETIFEFGLVAEYGRAMLEQGINRRDSALALSQLVRSYFFLGDYYAATQNQEQLIGLDSSSASAWMKLGSYRMMNGYYEEAGEDFQRAKARDSSDQTIDFNIALNHLFRGDREKAGDILTGIIKFPEEMSPGVESRIFLAGLLMESDDETDRSLATDYYHEVVTILARTTSTDAPSSQQQLWNGIAHLGLGDIGTAYDYLQTALYLEMRPFYQGMINLWLGKLADVRGESDVARHHYGAVLSQPSADYHQKEAHRYLETPYAP